MSLKLIVNKLSQLILILACIWTPIITWICFFQTSNYIYNIDKSRMLWNILSKASYKCATPLLILMAI